MAFKQVIDSAKSGVNNYLDHIACEMEKALGKVAGDFVALDKKLDEEKAERRKLQGELDSEKLRRTEIEQKLQGELDSEKLRRTEIEQKLAGWVLFAVVVFVHVLMLYGFQA